MKKQKAKCLMHEEDFNCECILVENRLTISCRGSKIASKDSVRFLMSLIHVLMATRAFLASSGDSATSESYISSLFKPGILLENAD